MKTKILHLIILEKICLKIVSDKEFSFGEFEKLLFNAYVPGITSIESIDKSKDVLKFKKNFFDFTIEHFTSSKKSFKVMRSKIVWKSVWNGILPFDIYHLISSVVHKLLLNKKLFCVHSSVAVLNSNRSLKSKSVLLLGHSGSGKTTTALELYLNYGYKLLSGNKTILEFKKRNSIFAVTGTNTFTLESRDFSNFASIKKISKHEEYFGRSAFEFSKDSYVSKKDISHIVIVKLTSLNGSELFFEELKSESALHKLYPYFFDMVNSDVIIDEDVFSYPVDGDVKKYCVLNLRKSLSKIPVFIMRGSAKKISEKINSLH